MSSRNLVVYAIAAATLGISSLSFAQGNSPPGQREEPLRVQRYDDRRDDRRDARDHRQDDRHSARNHRQDDRRDFRNPRNDRHFHARGPAFKRGAYIPREYRNRQYVVVNHRTHRLSAPPRGHQWVQVGADYVLIAVATGLIAHIVLNY
ncbi:MAG: RcnB family protein [Hydrogenophaga sp.]|uniref:RcnB family protein n=1 Tax=Hydrogenophaga sp. TaxID=1904254 RepID=UPI00276973D0|nr:RcnB family protein [Hydrogenophaga sp.]MDP2417554.1 RcnB family protein [Hydrogenophaga sp.]MDZ4189987.1 RcnB family protein [Hydrogenophaga sp.]